MLELVDKDCKIIIITIFQLVEHKGKHRHAEERCERFRKGFKSDSRDEKSNT